MWKHNSSFQPAIYTGQPRRDGAIDFFLSHFPTKEGSEIYFCVAVRGIIKDALPRIRKSWLNLHDRHVSCFWRARNGRCFVWFSSKRIRRTVLYIKQGAGVTCIRKQQGCNCFQKFLIVQIPNICSFSVFIEKKKKVAWPLSNYPFVHLCINLSHL